jgi:ketosteroid isomerase-like protein
VDPESITTAAKRATVLMYRLMNQEGGFLPMKKTFCWLVIPTLIAACADRPNPPDAGTMSAWESEVMEADRAFNQATSERGAAGWVSFFAPNGSMISTGVGEVRGTEAIQAAMEGVFADASYTLTWEPSRAEVSTGGDLGYTVGRYTSVRVGNLGQEVRSSGVYVSIWRRQEDGSWKVEMDLGNPTSP